MHAARQLNTPHTTAHKILRTIMKVKIYRYQLLQHVTAQDKFAKHFDLTFSQDVRRRTFYSQLYSMMKPHSMYQEIIIDITSKFRGTKILMH
jgi:hypothetical protein